MQRQKQQAISPDVQAVAKALAEKDGVEEALRLIEGLPDKDALDLLIAGSTISQYRRAIGILRLLVFVETLTVLTVLFCQILHLLTPQGFFLMIFGTVAFPFLVAILFSEHSLRPRAIKNGEEAVARYSTQIQQTDAVEALLQFSQKETTGAQTKLACWRTLSRLLPRLDEKSARALPEKSRIYLFSLLKEIRPELPQLSKEEKISVLLILATQKDSRTKRLMQNQLARPALREAAQSILDDW